MSLRRQELAENLRDAHRRIEAACSAAHRSPDQITLIAVTKTWPVSDLLRLIDLGVRDFGESREQEGHAKFSDVQSAVPDAPVLWHFIGQIQSNKAARIGEWADVVHSVDREGLITPLARAGRDIQALIQISLDGDSGRGGVDPADLAALARQVTDGGLMLRGVMGVAPLHGDPRSAFERLHALSEALVIENPNATWISAGMSGDLEHAIAAGATHVRLGTSILGSRY